MIKFYNKGEWKLEPHISIYSNGDFYIYYTIAGKSRIEMFKEESVAKIALEKLIKEILIKPENNGYRYAMDSTGGYWAATKEQCEYMINFFLQSKNLGKAKSYLTLVKQDL